MATNTPKDLNTSQEKPKSFNRNNSKKNLCESSDVSEIVKSSNENDFEQGAQDQLRSEPALLAAHQSNVPVHHVPVSFFSECLHATTLFANTLSSEVKHNFHTGHPTKFNKKINSFNRNSILRLDEIDNERSPAQSPNKISKTPTQIPPKFFDLKNTVLCADSKLMESDNRIAHETNKQYGGCDLNRIKTNSPSLDNKENSVPETFSPNSEQLSLTPKIAIANQKSPVIIASNSEIKSGFFFTYSPLDESYKSGNYFHFPDVDTPSALAQIRKSTPPHTSQSNNNIYSSSQRIITNNINNNYNVKNNNIDKENKTIDETNDNQKSTEEHITNKIKLLNVFSNDDEKNSATNSPDNNVDKAKSETARRARLKSISLDSDGARLVEENLYIPVEELVEMTNPKPFTDAPNTTLSHEYNCQCQKGKEIRKESYSPSGNIKKQKSINKKRLVIDLSVKDETLLLGSRHNNSTCSLNDSEDYSCLNTEIKPQTPKTPTIKQTRQKAISLDSEPMVSKDPKFYTNPTTFENVPSSYMLSDTNITPSSASVPTTPKKRMFRSSTLSNNSTKNSGSKWSKKNTKSFHTKSLSSSECHRELDSDIGESTSSVTGFKRECDDCDFSKMQSADYLLNASNSTHLKGNSFVSPNATSSNNLNLTTLPEIMAINEFKDEISLENNVENKENNFNMRNMLTEPDRSKTVNLLCTNSSEDIENDDIGGSVSSLVSHYGGGLSLSNYSLSNLQGSHCSLARSNYNLYASGVLNSNSTSKIRLNSYDSNNCTGTTPGVCSQPKLPAKKPSECNTSSICSTSKTFNCKKNLLQRRGSNTSLTLNIVGDRADDGNHSNLNRFNSHSSLNIMTTPYDIQRASGVNLKKGLLERRNSNTSLTLNIQKRALSTSNCNFRDSNLSLYSIANNYEKPMDEGQDCSFCGGSGLRNLKIREKDNELKPDSNLTAETQQEIRKTKNETANTNDINCDGCTVTSNVHRRKFLSSENLYMRNNSFQVCQTDEAIKAADYPLHGSVIDINKTKNEMLNADSCGDYTKKYYCSCAENTIRNITTKPLSPQTTSEDFKIYLANIQMLQNASNILTHRELIKLNYVFEKSYLQHSKDQQQGENRPEGTAKDCSHLPNEAEQNALLTNLHQEFWDLPTNYQEKPLVFGSQAKNRYKTILPNEHSRVILEIEQTYNKFDNDNQQSPSFEPYINANYIKGPDYVHNTYIATQGPMPNTTYDFWLMVYQNSKKYYASESNLSTIFSRDQKIVMLTDIFENDESKCAIYFPQTIGKSLYFINSNTIQQGDEKKLLNYLEEFYSKEENWSTRPETQAEEMHFNYFCIKNIGVCNKNGYSIRKLHCLYKYYVESENPVPHEELLTEQGQSCGSEMTKKKKMIPEYRHFIVHHYWFQHWPDHRSPQNIDVVLDMCLDVLDSNCADDFKDEEQRSSKMLEYLSGIKMKEKQLMPDGRTKSDNASEPGPLPIIHCSAGIGRTGCVAAILNGLHQIRSCKSESNDDSNRVSVDVLGIVSNLRLQRGGMVQNSEQYELIHRALCLYQRRSKEHSLE